MTQNKVSKSTLRRLMDYIVARHKRRFTQVVAAVVVSVAAGVAGSMFVQVIIDNYILRMVETGQNLFHGYFL